MKFRKKPVVIDAIQFDGTQDSCDEIADQFSIEEGSRAIAYLGDTLGMDIRTLEGIMTAMPGDWIIRGVRGEIYPCKPDIFADTYEAVNKEDVNNG